MGRKRKRKRRKKPKIQKTATFDITNTQHSRRKEDIEVVVDESSKLLSNHTEEEKEEIQRIFEIFLNRDTEDENQNENEKQKHDDEDSGDESDSDDEDRKIVAPPSKKSLKQIGRIGTTHLKRIVEFPEVVEPHDSNSHEPLLLINLKSYSKYVGVPKHWKNPKRYLQSKRGIEKPPFDLPEFIQKTGIEEIRNNIISKQKTQTARQRMRARMNPKLHKGDLDYQVLHDAFFKYQVKPPMTIIGDIFEEGKETNAQVKELRPGKLSKKLRNALGMPDGAPPPWLFNMQRYGPPPSYPWLKVPGVNGPIPHGAVWGYFPGGWGQAPRDENGKLLFTSVFLEEEDSGDSKLHQEECWGEVEEEEEEEEDEDEDDDEDSDSDSDEEEEDEEEEEEKEEEELSVDLKQRKYEEEREKKIQMEKDEISRLEPLKLRKIDASGIVPPPPTSQSATTTTQNEKKELYRVVEMQNRDIEQKELVGSTFKYDLDNKNKEEKEEEEEEEGEEKKKENESGGDLTTGRKRKRGWDKPPEQKRKKRKFKF